MDDIKEMINKMQYLIIGLYLPMILTCAFASATFAMTNDLKNNKTKEVVREVHVNKAFPNKYIGEFGITHYCHCKKCTGKSVKGKTVTGHTPKKGRTVAVDPKKIPLHSIIYVEDLGFFVAEDVGGGVKGNHLDIYVDNHEEALKLGTLQGKKKKVYIMR